MNASAPDDAAWSGPTHDFAFPVESGHVLAFARAIGEPDTLAIAPPTFAAATDHFDPQYLRRPPRGRGWGAGLPESHLHVEQHFTYARTVQVGEQLVARKGPGRRWTKNGRSGLLQFVEERTELRDTDGALVVVMCWVDVHAERSHADLTNAQLDRTVVPPPDGAVIIAEDLSRTQFVMYAGASGDFHPLHHDDDLAHRHGYPSVFAPGMLTMALTARALTDRIGHEALRSFGGRFRAQVWPGDTLNAVVAEQPAPLGRAFTVTARNQHGGLVFEATATATGTSARHMSARRLVLASASPARLGLLRGAGFAPDVVVSGVDEDAIHAASLPELVVALAEAKARTVGALAQAADAVVVGCDSLLDVDGTAHGKPRSIDEARTRLRLLRGRSAVLRTGHCVIDARSGRHASAAAATTVHFAPFHDHELEAYLATGEPLAVAGAFTLDGRSAPFIDRIEGDHGNVIGLSLPLLRELLARLHLTVMDLWT